MICPIETPSDSPWRIERTNERIAGVSARVEHVRERLVGRQAHALLLQRQPQLVAERAREALGRDLERAAKPEPGLDRDDEQVDQLGQLVVDLLEPPAGAFAHDHERRRPAREDRHRQAEHRR